jgi:four helix bundle protein
MVYGPTRENKFSKDFGLVDQARRAAVSIMANIAEGSIVVRIRNLFSFCIMHLDPHRNSKAISMLH